MSLIEEEETPAASRRGPRWKPVCLWCDGKCLTRFSRRKTKQALSEYALGYLVTKYAMATHLASINPHDLRHRFGYRPYPHSSRVEIKRTASARQGRHGLCVCATATLPCLQSHPYRVQAHQVNLFVGSNFLLSAHQIALPFTERVLTRGALHTEHAQIDSAFLLYILLDELLTYYEDLSVLIQEQIEQMEERALVDTSDGFLRPDFHYIPEQEIVLYYRDLDARLTRLIDLLRAAKESVNGIFDIYVSHVSHHTNNVIKILTIVSAVLLPSTLIFTFFDCSLLQLFGGVCAHF